MGKLLVEYLFGVSRLAIRPSLSGSTLRIGFRGLDCSITFPDSQHEEHVGTWHPPEAIVATSWRNGRVEVYDVHMLQIMIRVDSYLTASLVRDQEESDERHTTEADRVISLTSGPATELMHKVVDRIRVQTGQYWLASSANRPQAIGNATIYDENWQRVPISISHIGPIIVDIDDRRVLDEQGYAALTTELENKKEVELHDIFLADAYFAIWPTGEPDLTQAVLFAAIACEVKVKSSLLAFASADQQQLVQLVIDNPRDVTLSAVGLFDKGLRAIIGRSLREDNRELYKAVDQLFQDRNRIAHRAGSGVEKDRMLRHVGTASRVFEYLDSVDPSVIGHPNTEREGRG